MRWLGGIMTHIRLMDVNWSKLQEIMKDREAWCPAVHNHRESDETEQLDNNDQLV